MTFFRVVAVTARLVRQVSVGPAVVPNPGVGCSCTMISVEIDEGGSGFRDVMKYFDELKLARSERCSEGACSGCQCGYCGSVAGSGGV